MLYLSAVLLTTICSLLHDSDNPAAWITNRYGEKYGKWFGKWFVVTLHGVGLASVLGVLSLSFDHLSITLSIVDIYGLAAAIASAGIFWGVFRRGWIAQAELTAIRLKTWDAINAIPAAYPYGLGFVPKYLTVLVLHLPDLGWNRRLQSALLGLLWTGPISQLPIAVLLALG